MAEGYVSVPITSRDNQERVMFSASGERLPASAFESAIAQYGKTGVAPRGFLVKEPGSMLDRFYDVTMPMREAGEKSSERIAQAQTATEALKGKGIIPTTPLQVGARIMSPLLSVAGMIPRIGTEAVKTPAAAGATAATALTGGVAPALGLTIGPSMLATGAGSIAGELGAGKLFGNMPDIGMTAIRGGLAAVGQGLQHGMAMMVNGSMSRQAADATFKDFVELAAKEAPHLATDPNLLNYSMSNGQVVAKMANKYLANTADELVTNGTMIRSAISQQLKNLGLTFKGGEAKAFGEALYRTFQSGQKMLDNVNDFRALSASKDTFARNVQLVYDRLDAAFPGKNTSVYAKNLLDAYQKDIEKAMPGNVFFRAIEQSIPDKGSLTPAMVMKTLQDRNTAMQSAAADQAQQMAQQGMSHSVNPLEGFLDRIPGVGAARKLGILPGTPGGNMGRRYNQPLLPSAPMVGGNVAGQAAMRSFVGDKP